MTVDDPKAIQPLLQYRRRMSKPVKRATNTEPGAVATGSGQSTFGRLGIHRESPTRELNGGIRSLPLAVLYRTNFIRPLHGLVVLMGREDPSDEIAGLFSVVRFAD